ncbi:hypothetical protein QWY97_06420 [Vibrio cortegadensis]|uniref:hypothetical protein n=1 Tax=Vibrio cortegadensis TaxID=1328770 RepID=UPI0021C45782|nr:hypothetical protein [Vibrio cortegadensis]MDN3696987.1 hypothetical protein [Vibrio cortegadensis]
MIRVNEELIEQCIQTAIDEEKLTEENAAAFKAIWIDFLLSTFAMEDRDGRPASIVTGGEVANMMIGKESPWVIMN